MHSIIYVSEFPFAGSFKSGSGAVTTLDLAVIRRDRHQSLKSRRPPFRKDAQHENAGSTRWLPSHHVMRQRKERNRDHLISYSDTSAVFEVENSVYIVSGRVKDLVVIDLVLKD